MSDTIRALVAFSDEADRSSLEEVFEGDPNIDVVGYSDELDEGWQTFFEQKSDVAVVACSELDERAARVVDRAVKQRPERPVVVATRESQNGSLRRAFEAGADDVVTYPLTPEELRFALEKVLARRRGGGQAGVPVAPLVCILGPKGGTGKTLVASNLAVALSRRDLRVALVDLDLQFGDLGLALGLAPERTIYELAKAGPPYDHDKLDRHLMTHSSGVKVLVGPTRPDYASAISTDFLRDVYASLRTMSDIVIVDTPPGFTAEVIATIDLATSACIVGMLDSLSLKNTKLGIETLDLMGFPSENVALILNRADSRVGITHDDVAAIIGRRPDVLIPSDREIPRSVNEGTPIVASRERSEAAKSFQRLADLYTKKPSAGPPSPQKTQTPGRTSLLARRRK
jgi:pilus assembly protein CpaE